MVCGLCREDVRLPVAVGSPGVARQVICLCDVRKHTVSELQLKKPSLNYFSWVNVKAG